MERARSSGGGHVTMGVPVQDPRWKAAAAEPKQVALSKGLMALMRTMADFNKFDVHLHEIRQHVSTEEFAQIQAHATNIGREIITLQDDLEKMGDF